MANSTAARTPSAASRAGGYTLVRIRQIVARSGTGPGSPSPARSPGGASPAHSAIAAYDRAPTSIAHAATARSAASGYRRPTRDAGQAPARTLPAVPLARRAELVS